MFRSHQTPASDVIVHDTVDVEARRSIGLKMDNGGSAALLQTIDNELIDLHSRLSRLGAVHVMAKPQRFIDAEGVRQIAGIERSIKLVHGRKCYTH